jgi:hypothetical protein
MNIVELMEVAPAEHNIDWLKEALQAAIQLELATLPPYLCAMWSIKEQQGDVYDLIRGVAVEEMLHMGLACNMLTTIGGAPKLNTKDVVPAYPGPLPGGVRPELKNVRLSRLTKDLVKDVFMEIEFPEFGPIAFALGESYPTIGAFYDAVLVAFEKNAGAITGHGQVKNASVGLTELKTIEDVRKAIGKIKVQGEGTQQTPDSADGELAHYYRFAEIFHGRKLIKAPDGKYRYEGDKIPFPEVLPMADVPAGGYPESKDFDLNYTGMLDDLQTAWSGTPAKLNAAVGKMYGMADLARALMAKPLPSGGETYGPSFLLVR